MDDPSKLSDNFGQAVKIAEREEKKLAKEGLTEEFNQKFDEFIMLVTLEEVSQHEMDSWAGPSREHPARGEAQGTAEPVGQYAQGAGGGPDRV